MAEIELTLKGNSKQAMDTHTFINNQAKSKLKPGLKLIIIGVIITFLGALVIPAILILSQSVSNENSKEFAVPGSVTIEIKEPGQYFLWNHTHTVYKDVRVSRSKELPEELAITVTDENGMPLRLIRDRSYTVSVNGNKKSSIGYVQIKNTSKGPRKLNINVEGVQPGWIFSVSQFDFPNVLSFALGVIGVLFAIVAVGVGCVIWGAKKMMLASKTDAPSSTSI